MFICLVVCMKWAVRGVFYISVCTAPSPPPGARDLIPRMLLVDPLKRITIPEVGHRGAGGFNAFY